MERRKLLIADSSKISRALLGNILQRDFEILEVADGNETMKLLCKYQNDKMTLILDSRLPGLSGFEILEEMQNRHLLNKIPTIMILDENNRKNVCREAVSKALKMGASDYISRPYAPGVIRRSVINAVFRHMKKEQMMDAMMEWLTGKEETNEIMMAILDYAMEARCGKYRKEIFGVHYLTGILIQRLIEKTGKYRSELLDEDTICMTVGLRNIGEIMIPHELLQNTGVLTKEQVEVMKMHTRYGAKLVTQIPGFQDEKMVRYAEVICRWHHERWNGEGYPDGLKGDEIPIVAQVVSLADAYNSLTNQGGGEEAYSHEKILKMLHRGVCGSFNPILLECLDDMKEDIKLSKLNDFPKAGDSRFSNRRSGKNAGWDWEVIHIINELEKIGRA